MPKELSLEQRKFELDAEIQRREIALNENAARRRGISTEHATIIGAVLALLSGTFGAYWGGESGITIEEVKRIAGTEIEIEKTSGTIAVEKYRLQRDLVLKAIDKKTPAEVRNTLKFFAESGLIEDYKVNIITYLDNTEDTELPTEDRLGNLLVDEYSKKVRLYQPLLELVGNSETKGNYNAYFGNPKNEDSPRLTDMTINEVLVWQDQLVRSGANSSAAGKYQFLRKTIRNLITQLGLTGNETFSALNQDILAVMLLERRNIRKLLASEITVETFGNNLAKEWATLPVMNGPNIGKSYYRGGGSNMVVATVDEVKSALQEIKLGDVEISE